MRSRGKEQLMTDDFEACSFCEGTGETPTGAYLRSLREASGLTLKALAARIGVTDQYLCDIEHGRRRATPAIAKGYEAKRNKRGESCDPQADPKPLVATTAAPAKALYRSGKSVNDASPKTLIAIAGHDPRCRCTMCLMGTHTR
jgi:hypothetical protein